MGFSKKMKKKVNIVLNDLNKNHNHSIFMEIYMRNQYNHGVALLYRNTSITYEHLFEKVEKYALSLISMGYHKGSEIPVCMSMTPEFVYLFLAISRIGAKVNCFGEWFDKNYLFDILTSTSSKFVFVTDDLFERISPILLNLHYCKAVVFSLADSLNCGLDPYESVDANYKPFVNKISSFVTSFPAERIITQKEFLSLAHSFSTDIMNSGLNENVTLDDDFTITYTSGTTNPTHPKAVLHSVRSYMTLSRFKDSDISGMGKMTNLIVLAHFPTYVHAGLTTSIVDPLFESCTIALEPIYHKDFFIHSLLINKPNYVCTSNGFWTDLGKKLSNDPKYLNLKLPFLFLATVTGEGMSPGEELFYNRMARKHKFGRDKFPFSLLPVVFSVGGGASESSGIFVTLFKKYQELRPLYLFHNKPAGLIPLRCCDVRVVKENGTECDIDKIGDIALAGPCTMKRYLYAENDYPYSCVFNGSDQKWLKMGVFGSMDKYGNIRIHGRLNDKVVLNNGEIFPLFLIEEAIAKDKFNILSCTAVQISSEESPCIVIHFEKQPDSIMDEQKIIDHIREEINSFVPQELINNIYIHSRNNIDSFPIAPSGKRDIVRLIEEGTTNSHKLFF